MHDVVNQILNETSKRVAAIKIPDQDEHEMEKDKKRSIVAAIRKKQMEGHIPVISEVKPASPSQKYMDILPEKAATIAMQMERAGAVAISVLTEPKFFHGSLANLENVRREVNVPVLRKDFIIDEKQLGEISCDIILLITGVLGARLGEFVDLAISKGMEPLVETQSEEELYIALATNAKLIGINNRNFHTMEVSLNNTIVLAPLLRKYDAEHGTDHIIISESGIHSGADAGTVIEAGADALLIGTAIIKSDDIYHKTKELVEAQKCTKNFAGPKVKESLQAYVEGSEHI
ncbi:indole-3-glycerol-phosphate synthase [Methanomethylovorans sp.]|uniref:indole-3-glycerol-phosphate synthase n=1 Tax=Methanomethylovorans sp. TaxID=2758717 RepID=UPI002FDDE138